MLYIGYCVIQHISEIRGTNLTIPFVLEYWDGCLVDMRAQEIVCLCLSMFLPCIGRPYFKLSSMFVARVRLSKVS